MVQWLPTSQILRNTSRIAIKTYYSLLKLVNLVDYLCLNPNYINLIF